MTTLLQNVVNNGTGRNAKINGIQIAGKTGTTNNNIDAWFCGYSPDIEAIIWYGNDDNSPMKKIEGGGRTAAPVFKKFMEGYIKLYPTLRRAFEQPDGVYKGYYGGSDEYYTNDSPLPQNIPANDIIQDQENDGLLFQEDKMRIKILLCLVVASIAYGANLNTASKNELMGLGLSKGQALNIIKYRKAHKFKSIDELERVQGIGFNDMQKVKEKLSIKENAKVKKSESKNPKGKKK